MPPAKIFVLKPACCQDDVARLLVVWEPRIGEPLSFYMRAAVIFLPMPCEGYCTSGWSCCNLASYPGLLLQLFSLPKAVRGGLGIRLLQTW